MKIFNHTLLEDLYIKQRLNSPKIAEMFDCCTSTVIGNLEKYNIPRRTTGESLLGKFTGEKNPNYKNGNRVKKSDFCLDCGTPVTLSTTGYCKKHVHQHITRINYKNLTDRLYFCSICCDEISYNNKSGICVPCKSSLIEIPRCADCNKIISKKECEFCWECYKKPENNCHFHGGIGLLPYSSEFTKELKQEIRERDDFICQRCFKTECCEIKDMNRVLSIHHIDYNKMDCNKSNLITLCSSCNTIANGERDYWFAYYTYIMQN